MFTIEAKTISGKFVPVLGAILVDGTKHHGVEFGSEMQAARAALVANPEVAPADLRVINDETGETFAVSDILPTPARKQSYWDVLALISDACTEALNESRPVTFIAYLAADGTTRPAVTYFMPGKWRTVHDVTPQAVERVSIIAMADDACRAVVGAIAYSVKVREAKGPAFPAYDVFVKPEGAKRGRHIVTLIFPDFESLRFC